MARMNKGNIEIYDISIDAFRPVTLRDVEMLESYAIKIGPLIKKFREDCENVRIEAFVNCEKGSERGDD